jgi:hypothetical protein
VASLFASAVRSASSRSVRRRRSLSTRWVCSITAVKTPPTSPPSARIGPNEKEK